jgi:hypothetical protein
MEGESDVLAKLQAELAEERRKNSDMSNWLDIIQTTISMVMDPSQDCIFGLFKGGPQAARFQILNIVRFFAWLYTKSEEERVAWIKNNSNEFNQQCYNLDEWRKFIVTVSSMVQNKVT